MTAPEIMATLDEWLCELSRDRTHTPLPDQLAQLGEAWEALKPSLSPKYCRLIDARFAIVGVYLAADTMRQARERLTNH